MRNRLFAFGLAAASLAGTSATSAAQPNDTTGMTPREFERAKIREERRQAKLDAKKAEKEKKKDDKKVDPDSATSTDKRQDNTKTPTPPSKDPASRNAEPATATSKLALDLRHWKLTLPTDAAGKYDGRAAEVSAKRLAAGYKDSHFQVDADGSIIFWCPVDGATTEGTKYPRSELREMLEPGNPRRNWTSKGTHTLAARCRVLQVPSNPKVVIGQIHSYSGKAKPLVKLQFYKGRIEALVKSSPTKGKDTKLVWPEVGLNGDIDYEIKVQDDVLSLTVNGVTQTQNINENDPQWSDQTFYFKAGAYPQDNEGPTTEGARVSFSHLTVVYK